MIAVLDYEAGNQTSVLRALRGQGIPAEITADPVALAEAKGIIFPGVGAAGQAMGLLGRTGLDKVLGSLIAAGKPLLGVCLGCQILLEHSEENDQDTLGILPGRSLRFTPDFREEDGAAIRIPHMGWNSLRKKRPCVLLEGISEDAEFYFVHSYYVRTSPELVIATTYYGREFGSVLGRPGLWAAQFHVEKSGRPGLRLLHNFYRYCLAIRE